MNAYDQQPPRPRDMNEIRARRERSRQQARLARIDLLIGLGVAIALLIVSPGLAMTGIIALLTLLVIAASVAIPAYKRRRAGRPRTAEPRPR